MDSYLGQKAFTLIELLVVIAIIGILASIGVAEMSEYKQKAYNASALSHLVNLRTSQEAYFTENNAYLRNNNLHLLPGFRQSNKVTTTLDSGALSYLAAAHHSNSSNIYCYEHILSDQSKHFELRLKSNVASASDCH